MHRRALVGVAVVAAVVVASLAVSPSATLAALDGVADDPVLFGGALVVCYLLRPLVAWPTTLVAVVVGYGYGVALGVPVGLAGAVLTSMPAFAAGRYFGDGDDNPLSWVAPGERFLDAAGEYFESTGGFRGVTAARLAPLPADAVTATAAMTGVSLPAFVAATLVGELPWTIAAVLVGSSLSTLSMHGVDAVDARLAVGLAVAAALVIAGPFYRRVAVGE
ncbi:VTT domain-containing protein [Halorubellus sp. JP-L1]|uniref:TVP38/TMEM64 family protein n=1 Tax=Halorubellus sp. JP-L1 TaxID=2715753 RepID=UPI00140CF5D2|nr:VTT domain-containing protein [Halorubellus sp. JP-L1]NHN41391.1 VTT domain-containing protein [Halorubellus sp. JP-L1]